MNPSIYLPCSSLQTAAWLAVLICGLLHLGACDRKNTTQQQGSQAANESVDRDEPQVDGDHVQEDDADAPRGATWSEHQLTWNDSERRFLAFEPEGFERDSGAVVLFAHGYGDEPRSLIRSLPIERWASDHGFAAIVPFAERNPADADGGRTSWNAGVCCAFGDPNRDDLGFIHALVQQLQSRRPETELDFYLIGFSNGGFLAETVACRHPDWFQGVSSIGGSLSLNQPPCERPSSEIRIHRVSGGADQRIQQAGGETSIGRYASFDEDFDTWTAGLECSETTEENAGTAACRTASCNGGAVRFCLVEGLGHHWPMGRPFGFDAFEDAWSFWTQ